MSSISSSSSSSGGTGLLNEALKRKGQSVIDSAVRCWEHRRLGTIG